MTGNWQMGLQVLRADACRDWQLDCMNSCDVQLRFYMLFHLWAPVVNNEWHAPPPCLCLPTPLHVTTSVSQCLNRTPWHAGGAIFGCENPCSHFALLLCLLSASRMTCTCRRGVARECAIREKNTSHYILYKFGHYITFCVYNVRYSGAREITPMLVKDRAHWNYCVM